MNSQGLYGAAEGLCFSGAGRNSYSLKRQINHQSQQLRDILSHKAVTGRKGIITIDNNNGEIHS